jgi:hypothetical protein
LIFLEFFFEELKMGWSEVERIWMVYNYI